MYLCRDTLVTPADTWGMLLASSLRPELHTEEISAVRVYVEGTSLPSMQASLPATNRQHPATPVNGIKPETSELPSPQNAWRSHKAFEEVMRSECFLTKSISCCGGHFPAIAFLMRHQELCRG